MKKYPRVHQLGFVVDDIDRALKEYGEIFQIPRWYETQHKDDDPMYFHGKKIEDPGFRLFIGYCGKTEIELITTSAEHSLYADFLKEYAPGLHHISFFVTHMEPELEELKKMGFEKVQNGAMTSRHMVTEYAYMARPSEKFSRIIEFSTSIMKGLRANRGPHLTAMATRTHDVDPVAPYRLENRLDQKIGVDQIGFIVTDMQKAMEEYGKIYHIRQWYRAVNKPAGPIYYEGKEIKDDGFDAVIGYCGKTEIELITTSLPDNLYGRFLHDRGPGLNHFCFFVKDIEKVTAQYEAMGFKVLQKGCMQGRHMRSRYTYLVRPGDEYGRIVELGETKWGNATLRRSAFGMKIAALLGDAEKL